MGFVDNKGAQISTATSHPSGDLPLGPANAGDLLVALFRPTTPLANVTGPVGYTAAVTDDDDAGAFSVGIWYKVAAGGEQSVTFTTAGSVDSIVELARVTGALATPLDKTGNNDPTGTSQTSCATGTTGVLSQADEIAFGIVATSASNGGTEAIGSGFTILDASVFNLAIVGHKTVSTGAALNPSASWATGRRAVGVIATFKLAGPVTLASLPRFTLEAAFGDPPLATEPTWTSISSSLMTDEGFSFSRGKQKLLDQIDAGGFECALLNQDRRFDPYHTAGAYYPNVKIRTRIRLRAVWAGVAYPLFDGYVDDWLQETVGQRLGVCQVNATDAFKLLNLAAIDSVWAATIRSLAPDAWYRLGEPDLSAGVVAADSMGSYNAVYGAAFDSAEGLVEGDPDRAASAPQTAPVPSRGELDIPWALAPSGDFTFGVIGKYGGISTAALVVIVTDDTPALFVSVGMGGDGDCQLSMLSFADPASIEVAGLGLDLAPHFIVGVRSGGTALLYVDGALIGSETVSTTSLTGVGLQFAALTGFDGTIDEVIIARSAFTAGDIADANDARTGWAGDPTGTRIGKVLDLQDWPAARRALDTGISFMQAAQAGTGLDMIAQADVTEHGYTFIAGNGDVTFLDRHHRILTTSSAFTFSDASATYPYSDIGFAPSEVELRNVAAYSAPALTTQVAVDSASVTTYGQASYSRTVYAPNTFELRAGAEWVVELYGEQQQRIDRLEIVPQRAPATLWPAVLAIEIGTRLTVVRTPQGVGSAITQSVFVEQIEHSCQGGRYVVTYDLSPIIPGDGFWVWGTTAWDGADMRWAF